ncbi:MULTISPECIES: hypothetical protein [Streptomyces]|uniref:hypothetical protein n=1 Tax=Streptomyces TaxID=1883 RepID=UPI000896E199|nr:hypothetical protein [Streptomyces sp. PAN_FS17]SEB58593.1 hypothetical protein SAMN05216482_0047 [Streptomyces sp. PAN_FS17]
MTSVPSPNPPIPPENSPPGPFITQHTALILLTAFVIGLIVAGLTFLNGTPTAGAALAGALSAGGSIPALRTLIR